MSATKEMVETLDTDYGMAEATKDRGDDFWLIGYPWGDARFSGDRYELRREMKRAYAEIKKDGGMEDGND